MRWHIIFHSSTSIIDDVRYVRTWQGLRELGVRRCSRLSPEERQSAGARAVVILQLLTYVTSTPVHVLRALKFRGTVDIGPNDFLPIFHGYNFIRFWVIDDTVTCIIHYLSACCQWRLCGLWENPMFSPGSWIRPDWRLDTLSARRVERTTHNLYPGGHRSCPACF